MKNLLRIVIPAFAFLAIAGAPQTASARDWGSKNTTVYSDHNRGNSWRHGNNWRSHCRTVTVKKWDRRRHRMVYTQQRVCR